MHKKLIFIVLAFSFLSFVQGQEIQARITVNVNKDKIGTQIDSDVFQTAEKIQCNFLLNINDVVGQNQFRGTLMVQAARPAYNSGYQCPLINYIDENIYFRYQEFQPVEFNENRIQGNDPLASNLTAVIAYWINIILGFDYDSFSLRGGDIYFQKAQNIVNNAPESRDIAGWKNFEGLRNRFWLTENINNNRFALLHDAVYSYYKNGMDLFYDNEDAGRNGILNCLNFLSTLNTENPNSMIIQFFFQGKSTEIVNVFSKANKDMKERALGLLLKLDITNARVYNELK